jgi:hypothetical protein
MTFDIDEFHEKEALPFWFKSATNAGHFTWRVTLVFVQWFEDDVITENFPSIRKVKDQILVS